MILTLEFAKMYQKSKQPFVVWVGFYLHQEAILTFGTRLEIDIIKLQ